MDESDFTNALRSSWRDTGLKHQEARFDSGRGDQN